MSIIAIASSIVLAYLIGRLDGRGKLPQRRVDVVKTTETVDFEGRVAAARATS